MSDHELVPGLSISDLIAIREQALARLREGLTALYEVEQLARRITGGPAGTLEALERPWYALAQGDLESLLARYRAALDRRAWRFLRDASGLRNLLDAGAVARMDRQLETDPPALTAANVAATFATVHARAERLFAQGVCGVFEACSRRYRSNGKLAVGRKLVLHRALTDYGGWNPYGEARAHLHDLERICCVLDGRTPPDHRGGAAARLHALLHRAGTARVTLETEYLSLRGYANGNLHVRLRRADLVVRINRILADEYGRVLGDDTHRRPR